MCAAESDQNGYMTELFICAALRWQRNEDYLNQGREQRLSVKLSKKNVYMSNGLTTFWAENIRGNDSYKPATTRLHDSGSNFPICVWVGRGANQRLTSLSP